MLYEDLDYIEELALTDYADHVARKIREVKARAGALETAARELLALKNLKDKEGKTPDYEARQPKAWEALRQALQNL